MVKINVMKHLRKMGSICRRRRMEKRRTNLVVVLLGCLNAVPVMTWMAGKMSFLPSVDTWLSRHPVNNQELLITSIGWEMNFLEKNQRSSWEDDQLDASSSEDLQEVMDSMPCLSSVAKEPSIASSSITMDTLDSLNHTTNLSHWKISWITTWTTLWRNITQPWQPNWSFLPSRKTCMTTDVCDLSFFSRLPSLILLQHTRNIIGMELSYFVCGWQDARLISLSFWLYYLSFALSLRHVFYVNFHQQHGLTNTNQIHTYPYTPSADDDEMILFSPSLLSFRLFTRIHNFVHL